MPYILLMPSCPENPAAAQTHAIMPTKASHPVRRSRAAALDHATLNAAEYWIIRFRG
jgi:hypothetical protein